MFSLSDLGRFKAAAQASPRGLTRGQSQSQTAEVCGMRVSERGAREKGSVQNNVLNKSVTWMLILTQNVTYANKISKTLMGIKDTTGGKWK